MIVPAVDDIIMDNSQRLYKNIFKANTPARDLQSALLASYMIQGTTIKGTLLDRVIKAGADPLKFSDNLPSTSEPASKSHKYGRSLKKVS